MITAHVTTTRDNRAAVELRDDGRVILKAYAAPDGSKLRIVMRELRDHAQVRFQPEHQLADVWRSAPAARADIRARHPRYAGGAS